MSDLIKREDAMDILGKLSSLDKSGILEVVRCGIKNLPSAEPEHKKGKWMSHYDYCEKHNLLPSGLVAFWWCDQCEQEVEHPTKFCPNCGADMRE